jgi:FtsH-binding integral membrane protein
MLFYYCGINVSEYHNWIATCINVLTVVRLCYFGSRDVFVSLSHILHFEKWLLDRRWFFNPYINGLTITLCIFCAIPLCALIYQINTDRMRITGIAIILFAFYVAIEVANKRRLAQAVAHGDDGLGGRVGLVVPMSPNAISAYLTTQFTKIKLTIRRFKWNEVLLWWIFGMALFLGWFVFQHEQKMMFKFGYVSGYSDAESGKKKKIDEQWLIMMRCYRGSNDFRGFPAPQPGVKSPCDD